MIRIEGIPVVAARLAKVEMAKYRENRDKRLKSFLGPIALRMKVTLP